ncbi:MAG: hypothetical protein EOO15_00790 [Chitinophagaceae bacterium]|nr:MAG: hypothetical protein EOO15_00790 [Chitinophagaceae bacterium]
MNPLFIPSKYESEFVEKINKYNFEEFVLIRLTQTMLEKSIIDASFAMRKVLFDKKLVDFTSLVPGGAKLIKLGIIITDKIVETKVSFYRPKSKLGDPRFCVYDLKKHAAIGDLLYLTIKNDALVAIPLKRENVIDGLLLKFFGDLHSDPYVRALREELNLLRNIGLIESVNAGGRAPKDVGLTLERFLRVEVNSRKTPDFLGKIELKSKRENSTKDSLFSKIPDRGISNYQDVKSIVLKFGYFDAIKNRIALYNNINTKPNKQGLYLFADDKRFALFQRFFKDNCSDDVCGWHYDGLQAALETKHPTTLWVDAEEVVQSEKVFFRYKNFQLSSRPLFSEFISLIGRDLIIFDWKAHVTDGKKRDHGPGFRIDKKARPLLFKSILEI